MVAGVKVTVSGVTGVLNIIDVAIDSLDPERITQASAAIMLNRMLTRFNDELDPDLNPWPPSEAATTGKGRKFGPGKTLHDTETLRRSIQLFRVNSNQMDIGTNVPYGIFHQEGTERHIARPFLGFNDQDVADVAEVVQNVVTAAVEKAAVLALDKI